MKAVKVTSAAGRRRTVYICDTGAQCWHQSMAQARKCEERWQAANERHAKAVATRLKEMRIIQ